VSDCGSSAAVLALRCHRRRSLSVAQAEEGTVGQPGHVAAGDYLYLYDGNGNVGQVVAWASGFGGTTGYEWDTTPPGNVRLVAMYEYDPYGNLVGPDTDGDGDFDVDDTPGPYAAVNRFRFSTKAFDDATGFGYWGYRWYSPRLGRWLSRDPIGRRVQGLGPTMPSIKCLLSDTNRLKSGCFSAAGACFAPMASTFGKGVVACLGSCTPIAFTPAGPAGYGTCLMACLAADTFISLVQVGGCMNIVLDCAQTIRDQSRWCAARCDPCP
jgi:RHS repeat-associated protein